MAKLNFQQSLLLSSVSHDLTYLIIINVENSQAIYMVCFYILKLMYVICARSVTKCKNKNEQQKNISYFSFLWLSLVNQTPLVAMKAGWNT